MYTLEAQLVSILDGIGKPKPVTFQRGDGRFINGTTIIIMPNGDTSMFCALNYEEKRMVLDTNRTGGGRWLANGSFTIFKKDMEA
jgi:hypothetical protein